MLSEASLLRMFLELVYLLLTVCFCIWFMCGCDQQ